ncbi:MAG TPA: PBP1A family penicillin-binding protein [Terriglobia bacterium]|nr:PBP1A family penicillin-binding protein [Terriglobia bacterium]
MANRPIPAGSRPTGSNRSLAGGPAAPKIRSRRIFGQLVFFILLLLSAGIGALAGLVIVYSADLPKVRQLEDYRADVMTELYADDGTVIGSFALEHRVILYYNQIPPVLRDAVLSIEDRHFESHFGVDIIGIVRAAIKDLLEWRKTQGASTLTQQLSRRFFLTPEKSFRRKVQEALLAVQLERHFTKPQIFTMWANEMDFGSGNFGFEAASEFFFGKHVGELTLPEAAMLAGIPNNSSVFSPLRHPERALERRNRVLAAMLENGKITNAQYEEAKAAPLGLHIQPWSKNIAPYFVDEVREFLEKRYGSETVQAKGLRVYTTLNVHLQELAVEALRRGLHDDDKRRGWRGPEQNIINNPPGLAGGSRTTLATYTDDDWKKPFLVGGWARGLVTEVKPGYALVRFGALSARVTPADFAWTHRTSPVEIFSAGDVDLFAIKELKGKTLRVTLDQVPDVQGAVLVIDNQTGAIKAMVGGYDYGESKYNRAVQAERQVGSSFKVYLYSQALVDGANPFDTIEDTPVSYPTSSGMWSPHNYDSKFEGTITLLHALAESRNVPAVRLLARVGVDKVIKLCRKFGITSRLVPNLPLALGASDLTLLEHTSAFTTFPDDGVHISPRMINRVTNYDGAVIDEFRPEITDVLPAGDARVMVSLLREVINSGTSTRARPLAAKYPIAGKTGTTNDFSDAWFIGFSPAITCGVWVGFDDHRTLGPKEEGSHVALPIWMDFVSEALKDSPAEQFPDSPLLTSREQVADVLASGAAGALLGAGGPKGAEQKESMAEGSAGVNAPDVDGGNAAPSRPPALPRGSEKPPNAGNKAPAAPKGGSMPQGSKPVATPAQGSPPGAPVPQN